MSIRRKLILLFMLIGFVPISIASGIAYATIRSELNSKTYDQLISIATKQEQRINALLQNRQEEIIKLTNRYDLQTAVSDPKNIDKDAIRQVLLDTKINSTETQRIYITDLSHTVIASTAEETIGKKLPKSHAVAGLDHAIATTFFDDEDDSKKLSMSAIIQVNRKDVAIASILFRVEDIQAALQDYTGLGDTGETIIAKKVSNGNPMSLFPLRHTTEQPSLSSMHLFNNIDSGVTKQTDYRGNTVLLVNRSIGFADDWVVSAKIDVAEAVGSINHLGRVLVIIMIFSTIGVVALAFYIARFFTKPIFNIARAAQQIGSGDFDTRVDVVRSDELGVLSESINAMAGTINKHIADLKESRTRIVEQNLELRHDQARLKASINSLHNGFIMTDAAFTVVLLNQAAKKMLSFYATHDGSVMQSPLRDDWETVQIDNQFGDNLQFRDMLREAQTNGMAVERKEIQYFGHVINLFVAPILDADPSGAVKTLGAVTIIEDVTEAKILERSKDEFFSIASHELRTPLTAIRGNASMMQTYYGEKISDENIKEMINDIHDSSTRLIEIVNDFLDVSRIEQGRIEYNLGIFALDEVIEKVTYDISASAKEKGVHVAFEHMRLKALPHVYADKSRVQQILYNIIGNALKFTKRDDSINISVEQLPRHLKVIVADTGEGIAPEAQHLLFHKFQQAGKSLYTRNTAPGTGLGLYICKGMIEQMNGTIQLESSVPGKGSTFSFTIPLAGEGLPPARHQQQSDSPESSPSKSTSNMP